MMTLEEPDVDRLILPHLPFLRRHARMMLGRQAEADEAVAEALERFDFTAEEGGAPQVAAFQALYRMLRPLLQESAPIGIDHGRIAQADLRLRSLAAVHRAALLLTAVEGLSASAVGHVLDLPAGEVDELVDEAQAHVERELETSVLIIEDEWTIAHDLRKLMTTLGHRISAVTATRKDAVAAAKRSRPGLVLADIQLADGSSGIDAVRDIFEDGATPTVFITAFPERLLTGERPEPTYMISKPYSREAVQATVSQALFFSGEAAGRA